MSRYYLFMGTSWIMQRLPRRAAYALAALLGDIAFTVNAPARHVAISNVHHVLGPSADRARVRRAARGCFRAAAAYYADLARTPLMDPARFSQENIRDTGFEHLAEVMRSGRGAVVASLHYGNPEYTSQCLSARGLTFLALVERLDEPRLAAVAQRYRASQGHEFVEVGMSGVKQAIRRLRAGGIVAVLIDRDIQHSGVDVPFFGATARLPVGAVDLAILTGAALIPLITYRTGLDRFDVTIEPPMSLVRTGDREADRRANTARLIQRFEPYLRRDPSQWFVLEEPIWRVPSPPGPLP